MKASPPWKLLWQTLTSKWFFFYSQCSRAGWAQSSEESHCCASFLTTLLLGNRSCWNIAWCLRKLHPQAANCQWVTIHCPAQLLISTTVGPAHSYCQWGTIGEVIKSRVVWWSSDGEWEKRQIQALFWRGWRSPSLGPVGELEGPGNRL